MYILNKHRSKANTMARKFIFVELSNDSTAVSPKSKEKLLTDKRSIRVDWVGSLQITHENLIGGFQPIMPGQLNIL